MTKDTNKKSDVGVVVVTHTDYGERLIAAAEMILGPQDACVCVSVDTGVEMDATIESLKTAVETVDKGAGAMLLTDMFGGTPTNLSLSLLGSGKLEVITGVNLPMLLKVLGMRSMPLSKLSTEAKAAGVQGIVVAGEVLRQKVAGGLTAMYWVRVDNRLIHGQIIETWLPFTKSRLLIVANDEIKEDPLRQEIMGLAIPSHVQTVFVAVEEVSGYLTDKAPGQDEPDALVLFANCDDARRAHEGGMIFTRLNLGNMHYGPGKEQVCAHAAVDGGDKSCLRYFSSSGVALDFRCVPNEPVQVGRKW